MRDERGFTLIEMMVAIAIGTVVLTGILGLVQVTAKNEARVSAHVVANQRARPVMTRLVDLLHSGCVAPGVAPVLSESSGTSLSLISKSGATVSPTPEQHIITLSGTSLVESIYAATGGTQPNWTFSTTPLSTRTLLTGVFLGSLGGTTVPVFQYYAYAGGSVSSTPLPTPLSLTNSTKTVKVAIAFATSPTGAASVDAKAPITLSDSATLRLEPASEDASEVNLPCV